MSESRNTKPDDPDDDPNFGHLVGSESLPVPWYRRYD